MAWSNFNIKALCVTWLGLLGWVIAPAQGVLTLEQCYTAAQTNHPLGQQQAVLQQMSSLAVANLHTNRWLPQLSVNGQASWQSEVTQLPIEIPNVAVPVISKDQYKLTLDASYLLYDGGQTAIQRDLQRANTALEQNRVNVELHRLKDQVNNLFLNAVLTDENIRLTQTSQGELQNRMAKVRASVRYGTVAQMNADELQAEYLRTEQRLAELKATRLGLRDQLALLTGLALTDSTRLQLDPQPVIAEKLPIARPELKLYESQRSLLRTQTRLISGKWQPRLSLFAQPGFGRPGLNFLDNSFQSFFIGGLRLNWNLSPAYTLHKERQIQDLKAQQVTIERATFEKNLSLQLRGQLTEIERLEVVIEKDQEIVALRTKIRQSAAAQLDNGAIAARDYTSELHAETQALLNQRVHELQLALARIQYRTMTGN